MHSHREMISNRKETSWLVLGGDSSEDATPQQTELSRIMETLGESYFMQLWCLLGTSQPIIHVKHCVVRYTIVVIALTLSQCTLEHQRILAGYTGTPLEKLSWNSPTMECHWRNLVESTPHWDATGETFAAYTGTPLEGLWQPTHAPTHIVKHAE